MNILFLITTINDSRLYRAANALAKNDHNVSMLILDRSNNYSLKKEYMLLGTKEKMYKITKYLIGYKGKHGEGFRNLKAFIKFQFYIFKFIFSNKFNIDVVHAFNLDTGFIIALTKQILNKKFVYDICDFYSISHKMPKILCKFVKKIEYFVINNSDATIICSNKRKKQILGTKPKRLIVIYNTPDNFLIPEKSYILNNTDRIKIGYIGTLGSHRMLSELLEVVSKNLFLELHIGGFGCEKMEKEIKEYQCRCSNIIFYNEVSYDIALSIENQCDLLTALYDPVLENHKYAAPNKFFEGLMLGKPLIMIKDSGFSEFVSEYDIGVVMKEANKEALKKSIIELINRKNEWSEMSKRMKVLYKNRFSWNKMENRLLGLYSELEN